jgi:hypothetical protein
VQHARVIDRQKEEAQGLHPRGLGSEPNDASIVADLGGASDRGSALPVFTPPQPSPLQGEGEWVSRRSELARLRAEYGDRPIPERVYRARGLTQVRSDHRGRKDRVRRGRVLAAMRALVELGGPFGVSDLAHAVGDIGPGGAKRVRHVVAQLLHWGRVPPDLAAAWRERGGGCV